MSQFMVRRYNGGDKPETDYFSIDAGDQLATAIMACNGEPLIKGGKPFDLRVLVKRVPARGRPTAFHRT